MGALKRFNLGNYGCNVYVETGTGQGLTLAKAYPHFSKLFSVDLDSALVMQARTNFPGARIDIDLSTNFLERLFTSGAIREKDSVLFFLDAHFPGADFHGMPYDVNAKHAVPLEDELKIIKKYRPNGGDFIICDDARIYMKGPFEWGNVDWLQVPGGLQFLRGLFDSDRISINFSEEGYIVIDNRER